MSDASSKPRSATAFRLLIIACSAAAALAVGLAAHAAPAAPQRLNGSAQHAF
jgi:hypothetical protein